MKKIFLPIIATAALGMGLHAYAWQGGDEGEHRAKPMHHKEQKGGERFFERLSQQLELTDEQKNNLKALHEQAHGNKSYRFNTRASLMQLDPNAADYSQQVATIAQTAADNAKARVLKHAEFQQQMYAQLTPEQQQKLRKIMAQKAARHNK